MMRKTLKVLSAILSYPTAELQAASSDLIAALDEEDILSEKNRIQLDRFLQEFDSGELLDLQERYVLLFDRTRSLSLHLFEHVHGESRDRGQAMVELQNLYEMNGLYSATNELPDYLPLFLEFLSTQQEKKARSLLNEPLHIIEALRTRLKKRKSPYVTIFSSLVFLAKGKPNEAAVKAILDHPDPDPDNLEVLDAAWEEEEVRFGPDTAECGKDHLISKLRAATRPADGVQLSQRQRTQITYSSSKGL